MSALPDLAQATSAGRQRRLLILGICSSSLFLTYLDSTILNVALPTIQVRLHASLAGLQWVVDAYLLVLASLLVLAGAIADRIGRRRVFTAGLAAFSAGSLLCSLAPNLPALVAFRLVQALGGCMLVPVSLSIVRNTFDDPRERAQALGIWSGVFGLAAACGPLAGGVLVGLIGWRSVFWVNVPIGVAALVLARRYVPESRAARPRRLDVTGQVLLIVGLGALTYVIIQGPTAGWSTPLIVTLAALAAAALSAFVLVERRHAQPLLELRFFRSLPFTGANVIAALVFTVLAGFLFVNTLYLQDVHQDSPLAAGLATLPATAAIALSAPLAGQVVARRGPRLPLAAAGLLVAAGSVILLGLRAATPYGVLAIGYVLIGLGLGIVNPPITNTAVTGMPADQAGVASAVTSSARQVGNVLGVAVMGAMLTAGVSARLAADRVRAPASGGISAISGATGGHRVLLDSAFAAATHLPWALCLGCGLAVAVVALLTTTARARATAHAIVTQAGNEPATPAVVRPDA